MTSTITSLLTAAHDVLAPILDVDKSKRDYQATYRLFRALLADVIGFADSQKGAKKLDDDKAAIFLLSLKEKDFKNKAWIRQRVVAELYALREYADQLLRYTDEQYASRYETLIMEVVADIEHTLLIYEFYTTKECQRDALPKRLPSLGRRPSLDMEDRFWAIKDLMWMENAPDLESLDFRNLRPHAIILIRQALEMIMHQVIGYTAIVDVNGQRDKKSTQAGADFIRRFKSEESSAGADGWKVTFPLPLKTFELINSWCNNFTHNPSIRGLHIQHFVYQQYLRLIRGKVNVPNVSVDGRDNMRACFELWIAENKGSRVVWPEEFDLSGIKRNLLRKYRRRILRKEIAGNIKAILQRLPGLFKG